MTIAVETHSASLLASRALTPPRVIPPTRPQGRLVFAANFLRNPLASIPEAVYEEDFVLYDKGRVPLVWITDPAAIKMVTLDRRDDFSKVAQKRLLGPLLGNGLLTAEGQEWKWQRQTAAPMFRHQDLFAMVPPIVQATEAYIATLSRDPSGEARAVDRDMTSVTFDVISATLLPGGTTEMGHAIETSTEKFQASTGWMLLFALLNVPAWVPRPGGATRQRGIHLLRSSVLSLIAQRRGMATKPDDLMQRLMDSKNPETGQQMSDEQLIDNLLTFYLAGHETTAKALTWTLFLLSRAPEWEERLLAEVQQVVGEGPVKAEHIDKLVLTQQVLKESMRLFPPAPQFGRLALKDCNFGPHTVKAGTQVMIPIYAIQRHKKYWTNPDQFDPTRFEAAKEAKISRYNYMPFGAGPRICIGMAFAMMEATAILATLIRGAHFKVSPDHNPEPISRVTLVPKGGMPMHVTRRG